MRLISKTYDGNIYDTTKRINDLALTRFVFSIQYMFQAVITIVVFKTESYPDYLHLCKRLGDEPVSTEEYFKSPE